MASKFKINGLSSSQAKYPDKNTVGKRAGTFNHWPVSLKQKPEDLAEAGFFYYGLGDHVVCFSCGGALKNWAVQDVPWIEHAKWFPNCPYLKLKKGQDFIRKHDPRQGSAAVVKHQKLKAAPDSELEELKTKYRDLLAERRCKICLMNDLAVMFRPCNHLACCVDCALCAGECLLCREKIDSFVRVYMVENEQP